MSCCLPLPPVVDFSGFDLCEAACFLQSYLARSDSARQHCKLIISSHFHVKPTDCKDHSFNLSETFNYVVGSVLKTQSGHNTGSYFNALICIVARRLLPKFVDTENHPDKFLAVVTGHHKTSPTLLV